MAAVKARIPSARASLPAMLDLVGEVRMGELLLPFKIGKHATHLLEVCYLRCRWRGNDRICGKNRHINVLIESRFSGEMLSIKEKI